MLLVLPLYIQINCETSDVCEIKSENDEVISIDCCSTGLQRANAGNATLSGYVGS